MFGKSFETNSYLKLQKSSVKSNAELTEFITERVKALFKSPEVKQNGEQSMLVKGLIRQTLGLLGLDIEISIKESEESIKVILDGKTYRGPMFWVTWACMAIIALILIASIPLIGFIIAFIPIIMFNIMLKQVQKKPALAVEKLKKDIEVEFG